MIPALSQSVSGQLPEPDKVLARAQRLRIRRWHTAAAIYGMVMVGTFITSRLGLGLMTEAQGIVFIGLAAGGHLGFYLLFRTGANLRVHDLPLTREQIIVSTLWGIISLHALPQARPIVLIFYITAFSFGMFILNWRQYLGLMVLVPSFCGTLLLASTFRGAPGFRPQYELFLPGLFTALLTWSTMFGGYIRAPRQRPPLQNKGLKEETHQRARVEAEKDQIIKELRRPRTT